MFRIAIATLLMAAAPAFAHDAVDRALRCVHAAMASLQPVGAGTEQLATVALARCFDEIEAVVAIATTGDAVRTALRRELLDYAMHVTGAVSGYDDVPAIADRARASY